ncbi:MAG: IS21 family transposase, partial [Fimbriimonadaceae bacterium]|nr:IS21 family transposase [Fimbriimonadaceae bacterium]
RAIARSTGVNRNTVNRYVQQWRREAASAGVAASCESNAAKLQSRSAHDPPASLEHGAGANEANLHLGFAATIQGEPNIQAGANGAKLHPGSVVQVGTHSLCWPHREIIQSKLDQGLTAQRIHQDLRTEHGFMGSYFSVLRFVQRLQPRQELPFRRMEVAPGDEVQVDFGQGAWIVDGEGKKRRPHLFRMVLSHSRKAYSEVVLQQTTDAFLQCLENAFRHFGGVTRTVVIDNLKAGVLQADWYDPELNPKLEAFARHYGTVILPTKPRTPRHKGKVERGIDYAQENALKGMTFASLHEQNVHLRHWESTVADTRIHGTTRQQVQQHFETVERSALMSLPESRFPNYQEGQRKVHRDGHVEVQKSFYSVPPEYLGHTVWVRFDERMVRVFNQRRELIASHLRRAEGRFSTLGEHLHSQKISQVEQGAEALLKRVALVDAIISQWAVAMYRERGIQGIRSLIGLLSLCKQHQIPAVSQACHAAQQHQAYRLRDLRQLLQRQEQEESLPLLDEHPVIRSLSVYGELARQSVPSWSLSDVACSVVNEVTATQALGHGPESGDSATGSPVAPAQPCRVPGTGRAG